MSRSSSSIRVLVTGSGTVGAYILRAMTSAAYRSRLDVALMVRDPSLKSVDGAKRTLLDELVASGLELVQGDLQDDVDKLTSTFRGFDVVVSAGAESLIPTTEPNLIAACQAAGVEVFVQNEFGFNYSAPGMELSILEGIAVKERIAQQLTGSGLGYLIISTGLFAEWAFSTFAGLDLDKHVITAPYSFDTKLTLTSLETIGRSVAELIVQRVSNQRILLASDTVTYEQIATAVEAATGKSLKRVVRSRAELEQLIKAEPTDPIPRFHIWFGEQIGVQWDKTTSWNNTHGIPNTAVEDIAKRVLASS